MSNEEFLKRLEAALSGQVPQEEVDDALNYHREYFAEAGENAANEIPAPEEVAAQIIRERNDYLRKRQLRWARPAIIAALGVGLVLTFGMMGGRWIAGNLLGWGGRVVGSVAYATPEPISQVTVTDVVGEATDTAYVMEGTDDAFYHRQEGDRDYMYSGQDIYFESIVIEGVSGNVFIGVGNSFMVDLWHDDRETVDCQVRDGVLHITGKVTGALSTGFQQGQINIIVPEDGGLYRIQVETDMGDISLERVSAGEVELDTELGNISVSGGMFDLLDCDSDMGDVTVTSVEAAMLKCSCDAGIIEAVEFDATEAELVADLGSITAIAAGNASGYDLELEVDLGELKLNGEKRSNSYFQTVHADRSIHAKVDTGNITLDFMEQ